jgi:hypothetical protein
MRAAGALAVVSLALSSCGGASHGQATAATVAAGTRHYTIRGIYDRDSSKTGFDQEVAIGFDYIDSGPYPAEMRALVRHHLKGVVWLGGYDNTTCSFHQSDAWVRSHVSAIAGSAGVGAYFIDDEPNASICPTAPAQIRARAALVKSIDAGPPTLLVTFHLDQLRQFAGAVDVIGLDHYPCSRARGCNYSIIDREAALADQLGIRYWGVVQAQGDAYYRVPTADELHQEFVHWRRTRMQGYLVFAWRWPRNDPSLWLANHPVLQAQLARENAQ